jgi:ankyrin repeat protein
VEMGANVNARDGDGLTPLHFASSVGVVRILLDAGATVDAPENSGWTTLFLAIRYNFVDNARVLIDRGANVSNVKLDNDVPAIPDWVSTFVASRSNCRCVAIVIIGIHKYHRTHMTGNNDINVLKLIAKHIWSTRMDGNWIANIN